jgi:hypothetical protein
MDGSNEKFNLVSLTAREHFVVHWLLTKMSENNTKMKLFHAFKRFSTFSRSQCRYFTSLEYSKAKQARSFAKHSKESRQKMSAAKKGIKLSASHRKKYSLAKKGKAPNNKGKTRSIKAIEKSRLSNIGLIWWNNTVVETKSLVCPGEGYIRGRLPSSSKDVGKYKPVWFTNGKENKVIDQTKIDQFNEPGWYKGRTSNFDKQCLTWWNNNIIQIRCNEKPDTTFNRGMLKRNKNPTNVQEKHLHKQKGKPSPFRGKKRPEISKAKKGIPNGRKGLPSPKKGKKYGPQKNPCKNLSETHGINMTHTCPHCHKIGKGPQMFRYHFNKCKSISLG